MVGPILTSQRYWRDSRNCIKRLYFYPYFLYSKTSPGWQDRALQIASKVEKRIALALLFFKTEMLAMVIPTLSARSVTLILRLASMTSMFMIIAMVLFIVSVSNYTVKSFSDFMSTAFCKVFSNTALAVATTAETRVAKIDIAMKPAGSSSAA